jgi:hypothetical protein
VPLPDILSGRFQDPAFWRAFFFDEEDTERVPEVIVDFPVGGGCHIVLEIEGQDDRYELGIRTPTSGGVRSVGWDDLAHWHPYAFRWSELDLICRAVAAVDPALPHPGPALVLLCRFVSVHDDDDVGQITATMHSAFESLRPDGWTGSWPNAADWLGRRDFRGLGVSWIGDGSGNLYAVQDEDGEDKQPFYSMRGEPSDDPNAFRYNDWRVLLRAAESTLARAGAGRSEGMPRAV